MQDRQAGYLLDMLRSAEAIQDYIRGCDREEFLRDAKTQDAVLRRLLVIGEAAAFCTCRSCGRTSVNSSGKTNVLRSKLPRSRPFRRPVR